jgi:hypothetical protein
MFENIQRNSDATWDDNITWKKELHAELRKHTVYIFDKISQWFD